MNEIHTERKTQLGTRSILLVEITCKDFELRVDLLRFLLAGMIKVNVRLQHVLHWYTRARIDLYVFPRNV